MSELRTQFQCEYKLYLMQQRSEVRTKASIDGMMLHSRIMATEIRESHTHRGLSWAIIILIIIIGIMWIVW